ncbi:hypothetical protein D3C83_149990 [compost metagenome]
MMFSVRSAAPISTKAARIASGIDSPMMIVFRNERRNTRMTRAARTAPISAESRTEFSASRMNPDWSYVTCRWMSAGM